MSELTDLILGCNGLKGTEKLVLWAWARQAEESGGTTAYASKKTVGLQIGRSDDTVLRSTKRLVAAGWLIDTGERKRWEPGCWTPVYEVALQKIMDLAGTDPQNAGQADPHFAAQGSSSFSVSVSSSFTNADAATTGLRPAHAAAVLHREGKPANRKPNLSEAQAEARSLPVSEISSSRNGRRPPLGQPRKSCPDCGEKYSRDQNHLLACHARPAAPTSAADAAPVAARDSEAPVTEDGKEWDCCCLNPVAKRAAPGPTPATARCPDCGLVNIPLYVEEHIKHYKGSCKEVRARREAAASGGHNGG